tara:strand:+ start:80 stop:907 length:828 start_codon:yes stop_codon:yes gene_type:complete
MPDKISFTDFGGKKKVRRIKRRRKTESGINKEKMLDDLLLSKKDSAPSQSNSKSSSDFQFPFLELASSQSSPSAMNEWTPLEVSIINSGNGIARSVTISFDNLETRGKTILDKIDPAEEITLNFEVRTSSKDRKISRMDLYYHTVEGDTFSVVRRDWFPNDYEQADIFFSEIPPGEEDKADLYSHREVVTEDFHVVCGKCGARAPANFRICGKCGSRLQKRSDRRDDWGSNLKDTTAVKDKREVLIEKLRKLGELKDRGMLSPDEFSAAKAQLLK